MFDEIKYLISMLFSDFYLFFTKRNTFSLAHLVLQNPKKSLLYCSVFLFLDAGKWILFQTLKWLLSVYGDLNVSFQQNSGQKAIIISNKEHWLPHTTRNPGIGCFQIHWFNSSIILSKTHILSISLLCHHY